MGKNLRRLLTDALFTVIALTIFLVELAIPSIGIPGVKLGLANIVTVAAVFLLTPWDAGGILLARILLGGIFSGQVTALLYSLAGGTLCWLTMLPMRKIVAQNQIWVLSVVGAIAHNIGQILIALVLTGTPAIFYYLPILMVSGILAGILTGAAAQALVHRLSGRFPKDFP